jgi:hypothetical protein
MVTLFLMGHMNQQERTPQASFDLTHDIVAELGRLFLLTEAVAARNMALQTEVEALKARVKVLEGRERLLQMEPSPRH